MDLDDADFESLLEDTYEGYLDYSGLFDNGIEAGLAGFGNLLGEAMNKSLFSGTYTSYYKKQNGERVEETEKYTESVHETTEAFLEKSEKENEYFAEETKTFGNQGSESVDVTKLAGRYTRINGDPAEICIYEDGDGYRIEASCSYYENIGYIEGELLGEPSTRLEYRGEDSEYTLVLSWETPDYVTVYESGGEPGGMGTSFAGDYSFAGMVE